MSGPAHDGLYQPHGAVPANDTPTYHDLVDTGLADPNLTPIGPTVATGSGAGINGYRRFFNLLAGAPWLYNPTANGGTFISYIDPASVRLRVALVKAARPPRRLGMGDQQRRQRERSHQRNDRPLGVERGGPSGAPGRAAVRPCRHGG